MYHFAVIHTTDCHSGYTVGISGSTVVKIAALCTCVQKVWDIW